MGSEMCIRDRIMTGRQFSAQSASQWQLVNEVVTSDELMPSVLEVGAEIAALAPLSVAQVKSSISVASQVDITTGYAFEIAAYNRLVPTADRLEGVAAFNEKRKPNFRGE